ncbi:hypothetical protein ACFWBN_24280 [Streptomyces sp. NPDC059989]|uniref:hypothetical protein n=1 Tax=Streptomyces sp. NPDC059989 TaxID=3347026 RepID=UPI0036BC6735
MARTTSPRQKQALPGWVAEGVQIFDPLEKRKGVVQFIGEYEDPATRISYANAVFARPEGGGVEWVVQDPLSLERG